MFKRKRSGAPFVSNKRRKVRPSTTRVVIQGGNRRTFVARSYGNPLAVTERKYFDSTRAALAIPSWAATSANGELDPAVANCLFSPIQGDDFNNRTGRKVTVLAIKIRGTFNIPVNNDLLAATVTPTLRILMVQDQQTNAAQLNSEDVVTTNVYGFQNPAFFGRFKVIKDKFLKMPDPTRTGINDNMNLGGIQVPFKMNIKFKKPVIVHYNSTNGGTVADVIDNSFHLIGGCTDAAMTPSIAYTSRTVYMDF